MVAYKSRRFVILQFGFCEQVLHLGLCLVCDGYLSIGIRGVIKHGVYSLCIRMKKHKLHSYINLSKISKWLQDIISLVDWKKIIPTRNMI